jgi:hypothetical protein
MNPTLPHLQGLSTVLSSLVLSGALLGCAASPPAVAVAEGHGHATKRPEAGHVYRLDFVVSSSDASKPVSHSSYTMNLEEDRPGELHLGTNVALSSQARMDVGLKIHCSYAMVGDDLLLHNATEMSSFDEPPTVRKIATSGDALLAPGKLALVNSLEDPVNHRRYEIEVTATKLR